MKMKCTGEFILERTAQTPAFHFVHLFFGQLLYSKIFHRFHSRNFCFRFLILYGLLLVDGCSVTAVFIIATAILKRFATFAMPFCDLVGHASSQARFCFLVGRLFYLPRPAKPQRITWDNTYPFDFILIQWDYKESSNCRLLRYAGRHGRIRNCRLRRAS